jgi:hypothetical protein
MAEVVSELLALGASPEIVDLRNRVPYDLAQVQPCMYASFVAL